MPNCARNISTPSTAVSKPSLRWIPTKLSDTGLFASVKDHTPAGGVVPFSPNAKQWQDGATAEWLVALPELSSVVLFDKPRPLPGQVFWHDFRMQFPPDAVLVIDF